MTTATRGYTGRVPRFTLGLLLPLKDVLRFGFADAVEHLSTTTLPPLDLRERVRVFAIEVLDPEGEPLPAARVRVLGSGDPPASRQLVSFPDGSRFAILVATTGAALDLEVSEPRSEPQLLRAVDDDLVVTLRPKQP